MLSLNYSIFNVGGSEFFGEYTLYQKFIFFPLQLFSAVAPILWMKHLSHKSNALVSSSDISRTLSKLYGLFLIGVIIWCFIMYLISPTIVKYYSGKEVDFGYLPQVIFVFLIIQIRDLLSVKLNAYAKYSVQISTSIASAVITFLFALSSISLSNILSLFIVVNVIFIFCYINTFIKVGKI
ncbi:hypothetical protein HR45_13765 [Shewanella mangrovi]|uniref:Polysaccharide biosynthesis protein C-terminal domain-containing protein n=2 Tax=Shewanella mangrovi TaxID=1515746 RepID=A0A094JAG3_9GAMM|nr:hypothetical protein HR45_13765 [Shewanella mangrovi]